jgi:hypothetical protein
MVDNPAEVVYYYNSGENMSRYPYEDEIEGLVQRHFNLSWSFKAARNLPNNEHSQAILAIRQLLYDAMTKSFNRGIEFQKSGKRGMSV